MSKTDFYFWDGCCFCLKSQLDAGSSALVLEDISKLLGAKPNSYPVEFRISDGVNCEYVTFTGVEDGVPQFDRSGSGTFPAGSSVCFAWTPTNIRNIICCSGVDEDAVFAMCVVLSEYDNKGLEITSCNIQSVIEEIICAVAKVRDSVLSEAQILAIISGLVSANGLIKVRIDECITVAVEALTEYINNQIATVNTSIGNNTTEISNLQQSLASLTETVDNLSATLTAKCDEIEALTTRVETLETTVVSLQDQIDDCDCGGGGTGEAPDCSGLPTSINCSDLPFALAVPDATVSVTFTGGDYSFVGGEIVDTTGGSGGASTATVEATNADGSCTVDIAIVECETGAGTASGTGTCASDGGTPEPSVYCGVGGISGNTLGGGGPLSGTTCGLTIVSIINTIDLGGETIIQVSPALPASVTTLTVSDGTNSVDIDVSGATGQTSISVTGVDGTLHSILNGAFTVTGNC